MKWILLAVILVGATAGAASAGECPMLQAQIDKALGTRFDKSAADAKAIAAEGMALHRAGKHAESVAKYEQAANTGGMTLQRKK